MTTLLLSHPAVLDHDMGLGHPERPDRLRALMRRLDDADFASLRRLEAPAVTLEAAARAHPAAYVEALAAARPGAGELLHIDPDTAIGPGTWNAVSRAAGGAVAAVDAVMLGEVQNAFVAMRPPGHHAETARAMGFCFLNHAAIAARHAQHVHGVERVAIVDFDVHHGNGTQDIFWDDRTVLYCSTHEMPLFPGTGRAGERGSHDTVLNVPLQAGDGGDQFRAAMDALILPRVSAFAPDLIILSAGFDAHRHDPLGHLALVEDDFGWVTRRLTDVAERTSGGRVVSILEGGYDLQALAGSAAAHVAALMGRQSE